VANVTRLDDLITLLVPFLVEEAHTRPDLASIIVGLLLQQVDNIGGDWLTKEVTYDLVTSIFGQTIHQFVESFVESQTTIKAFIGHLDKLTGWLSQQDGEGEEISGFRANKMDGSEDARQKANEFIKGNQHDIAYVIRNCWTEMLARSLGHIIILVHFRSKR
jgi:polyhydroxyalkanoate synthesis regulator protein